MIRPDDDTASELSADVTSAREIILAHRVVDSAIDALAELRVLFDEAIGFAARHIAQCRGRVVFGGVGKSGIAARKIASTFASLGTPSLFLHPADAVHGDLGMMCAGDVLVLISISGETRSLLPLVHYAQANNIVVIGITARCHSALAFNSDIVLALPRAIEAGPVESVPMASTVAAIVMGDALASLVAQRNRFTGHDLALLHPGGRIGQRLRSLQTLMHAGERMPMVEEFAGIEHVVAEMSAKGFGITGVLCKDSGRLIGVVTDGDLRRNFLRAGVRTAADLMHRDPITLGPDDTVAQALELARSHRIGAIFLIEDGIPVGIVDLQDLLRVSID